MTDFIRRQYRSENLETQRAQRKAAEDAEKGSAAQSADGPAKFVKITFSRNIEGALEGRERGLTND
jgi:hypothetical protein